MGLVDERKILRASSRMNRILFQLDPREAMLALAATVAAIIAHSWRRQEWDEVAREHVKGVYITLEKLADVVQQKRRTQ